MAPAGRCRFPIDGRTQAVDRELLGPLAAPHCESSIHGYARELDGLCWSDLDLDAGVIHVRQRADTWANIGATKSKTGKRDIPLAPIVLNALKQWAGQLPRR